jgi:serine/threonine protein kinase
VSGTWETAVIKNLRPGDPAAVGPYQLLGRLGVGGMGQVYLAKSPGGRLVAIKLIRPDLAEERGFRARFASEITAAKNVSGIYTAAVVDADAEAELPWMATVYVPGPSLTDAVGQNGPLPVKSVLALAAGLAEALQAIHRAGLVHRDLKPSNVLLATDGPRVIDFGISLALERSMMTSTGILLGSPGFMSPEQARGQREVGAPSDVFNLGAVLAFAATGSSPFGAGPTPALLYRVVNELPDLTTVPDRVRPLIWHCLAKNPSERPTPAEVLALLSDDVDVITGEWLPPSIAEAMDRYSQKAQLRLPLSPDEPGQPPAGPAPVSATVAETWTASATILDPASATRAEHGLVPATSLDLVPGLATAVWPGSPGDTGGTLPPRRRRRHRMRGWRWPVTAAAAVVVVAATAAVLIPAQSSGGSPKRVSSTASLAGDTTPAPAPASGPTTASLATLPAARPAKRATSRRAGHTPAAPASPTAAQASAPPSATASRHAPGAAPTPAPAQGATSAPAAPPTTSAPAPAQTPTPTQPPTTAAPTPTPTPSWSPTTQPTSGPTPSPEPAVTTASAPYHHHRGAPR